MGVIVKVPPVFGQDCDNGEPTFWGDGETPEFVPVFFADLVKCPLSPVYPPNGWYMMKQHEGDPCLWRYADSIYRINWSCFADMTKLEADYTPNWLNKFFYDQQAHPTLTYVNDYNACGLWWQYAKDGTATVLLP